MILVTAVKHRNSPTISPHGSLTKVGADVRGMCVCFQRNAVYIQFV
jgi:hypothetical protein